MDQKTLKCPNCREMNFPMVEFCHFCGESLHSTQIPEGASFMVKWVYHLIDAMFWLVDESVRWWEIGKLSIKLKRLRRQRGQLLKRFESLDSLGGETSPEQRQLLMGITQELEHFSGREEFLRTKCWAITPELLFLGIFLVFAYGLAAMTPARTFLPKKPRDTAFLTGQIIRVRDIPLAEHSVITSALWFDDRLFVGGDAGLTILDPVSGLASNAVGLPADFFVRDMTVEGDSIFIAGYSGIYLMEDRVIKKYYGENQIPTRLINAISVSGKDSLLIGSVGDGLLRGNLDSAVFVLGTQGKTVKSFGRLGNELWIMHENGILTGRGDRFNPLNLQVLAGRHLRSMITAERNVYVGTDQGVVAGYRNGRNWVWTLLSAGKPGYINDLYLAADTLFIASEEGLFRFVNGRMEGLSAAPCKAIAVGDSFLAAINTDSVMLYYFSGVSDDARVAAAISPRVGSFTPSVPVVSMVSFPSIQMGRLPDFSNMASTEEPAVDDELEQHAEGQAVRAKIALPVELQKPVFVDVARFGNKYVLITRNRGAWTLENGSWSVLPVDMQPGLTSFALSQSGIYAYGDGAGIVRFFEDKVEYLLESTDTKGLLHAHAIKNNNLLFLYADGTIRQKRPDLPLEPLFVLPGELKGKFHSVWMINDRYVVVVDSGIMLHETEKQWNLIFFRGRIENSEVVAVHKSPDNNLYIALNDGRVFVYRNEALELLGAINELPVSINFDGFLWVAGQETLFFFENGEFVAAPFRTREKILGAFSEPDLESIYVFTDSGLNSIAGR